MRLFGGRRLQSLSPSRASSPVSDPRDDYIARVVRGKAFCDVGGLWGTVSEKVSVAHAAGAAQLSMLDISDEESHLWEAFRERLIELDVPDVDCISADITAIGSTRSFDVVHCSGVLYHAPDPVGLLAALRKVTVEHLILASVTVPAKIDNAAGSLRFAPGQALFVPHLDGSTLQIVQRYFADRGIHGAEGIDAPVTDWSPDNYGPWWWLVTSELIGRMLRVAGFELMDDEPFWNGRAHAFLARCV